MRLSWWNSSMWMLFWEIRLNNGGTSNNYCNYCDLFLLFHYIVPNRTSCVAHWQQMGKQHLGNMSGVYILALTNIFSHTAFAITAFIVSQRKNPIERDAKLLLDGALSLIVPYRISTSYDHCSRHRAGVEDDGPRIPILGLTESQSCNVQTWSAPSSFGAVFSEDTCQGSMKVY